MTRSAITNTPFCTYHRISAGYAPALLADAVTYATRGRAVAVSEANRGRTGNQQNKQDICRRLDRFQPGHGYRSSVLVAGLQAIVRGQRRAPLRALARPEFHTVPAAEG